ncbi:hypothetical protein PSM36_2714 [Proteiniphilum saccharofermentans]|uniref:Uncharacterized protein n=1 Tax=Proteiniphilum saccharofermentans TaxID=1642647 RepID=A0A1R3T2Z5_9BACT|nr:hypothetical protein PSM36_2714 [Proteiniphilum saccharofermentans]SDZ84351.1 hypothetical protein SAMN05216331_10665 [Porphyromonadaceae bacterium KH3R12]SFS91298.1 hypothetical protein SAMN05216365_12930 [Porphyromonadaceae bacterium NLAE-zl-C104]SFU60367.1 hypothetical protein SAMN05216364_103410 [Porphyromonadaceae bacterium KHP3R9]
MIRYRRTAPSIKNNNNAAQLQVCTLRCIVAYYRYNNVKNKQF